MMDLPAEEALAIHALQDPTLSSAILHDTCEPSAAVDGNHTYPFSGYPPSLPLCLLELPPPVRLLPDRRRGPKALGL